MCTAFALTGCYVEVVQEHEAYNDTEVHYTSDVTDFSTQYLVDAALIPLALAAESPYMVINPDAYTSPRVRALTRASVIETTYAYLFDDVDCDYGGFTQTEAEADTTSYDDGYTYVELQMNAKAYDCEVRSRGYLHTVNSDIDYDVTGWYDDWQSQVSSIDAALTGSVQIDYAGYHISHSNLSISVSALTATDFSLRGSSTLLLDDGHDIEQVQYSIPSNVHMTLGDTHPHQGRVRLYDSGDWVELTFETNGLWRSDSDGGNTYYYWSELGFN
jgi:hypothetical protein